MMKRTVILLAVLTIAAVPATAQKAFIDYDSSVDFDALETFAWRDSDQPSLQDTDPLMDKYIVDSIIGQLKSAGLKQVEENPDFFVTYHGESSTSYSLDTMSYGYGYGGGWRMGGYGGYYGGPSTTSVRSYDEGTLIIDAWDGAKKELIWRGLATTTWSDNPNKARKKVDKMIAKIVKKWDKEHRQ